MAPSGYTHHPPPANGVVAGGGPGACVTQQKSCPATLTQGTSCTPAVVYRMECFQLGPPRDHRKAVYDIPYFPLLFAAKT